MKPQKYKTISEIPVSLITFNDYKIIAEQTHMYPITIHNLKYLDLIFSNKENDYYWPNKNIYYETMLLGNDKSIDFLTTNFYPLSIFYNFTDLKGRDNIAIFSEDALKNTHKLSDEIIIDSSEFLMEITKRKDILLSLFTKFNKKLPKYCHLKNCKYFELDLCRRWNAVPSKSNLCAFPTWFALYLNKKIDITNKKLIHLKEKELLEIDNKDNAIRKKINHNKKYNYVNNNGNFILDIPKQVVIDKKHDFILEFVGMIATINQSIEILFNSIILDFSEYKDDEREVSQILEIRNWINSIYNIYPYFPIFLNFENNHNQKLYILPCLVEHDFLLKENGNYQIKFNESSYMNFMKKTLAYIIDYANHLKINEEKLTEQFINNLM